MVVDGWCFCHLCPINHNKGQIEVQVILIKCTMLLFYLSVLASYDSKSEPVCTIEYFLQQIFWLISLGKAQQLLKTFITTDLHQTVPGC